MTIAKPRQCLNKEVIEMEIMEKRKEIEFDEVKFRELLVYIANKCENDIYFGATKLNKILFYSDFICYYMHGKPITGAEYKALQRGPVPTILKRIREQMHGIDIAIQIINYSLILFPSSRIILIKIMMDNFCRSCFSS